MLISLTDIKLFDSHFASFFIPLLWVLSNKHSDETEIQASTDSVELNVQIVTTNLAIWV